MEYVDRLNILGDEVRQIPCIVGNGPPIGDTECVAGGLYMDTSEENAPLYKCIPNDDGTYTWARITDGEKLVITYDEQTLTEQEQAQARANIGAAGKADIPDNSPKAQFKNIRFGFIGDSQTEYNGAKTKPWSEYITDSIGNKFNYRATAMFTIAKNSNIPAHENPAYAPIYSQKMYFMKLAEKLSKAVDAVIVMGGLNDVGFNSPLGTPDDTGNTTFYGGLNELCQYLLDKYWDKPIIFITENAPSREKMGIDAADGGITIEEMYTAIKEVCAKYAFPVYEAHKMSGICLTNEKHSREYTSDELHLNDAGQKRLGEQIAKYLQSNIHFSPCGEFLPKENLIGKANHAYYSPSSKVLSVDSGLNAKDANGTQCYGGVMLPGVTKISVDLSVYDPQYAVPYVVSGWSTPGWFALKQSDGTFYGLSPYNSALNFPAETLAHFRGVLWGYDKNLVALPGKVAENMWATPTAKPSLMEIVLDKTAGKAKLLLDGTQVYETDCVELGYMVNQMVADLEGVTLTYAE